MTGPWESSSRPFKPSSIHWAGRNVVIVNDQHVTLADDGATSAAARTLLEDLTRITAKPVRTLVNTHFHYDHTDGN